MNAYEVHSLIMEIAATSSRVEKEALIRRLADDPLGAFIIRQAYDPFITYGIKPKLYVNPEKPNLDLSVTLIAPLLKKLVDRELTGKAAEREIYEVMEALSPDSARLLFWILSKDLKCGIAETTINLAVPGLVPTFAVMRAHKFEGRKVKAWPWKGEPKLDGQRNTLLVKNGKGAFFTRSGKVVPALDFLVPEVLKAANYAVMNGSPALSKLLLAGDEKGDLSFMLDGEAMMGLFKDTGALRRKGADAEGAELHLYDIMSYDDFNTVGAVGLPLKERRALLSEFVELAHAILGADGPVQMVPQYFINSEEEALTFADQMMSKPLATYLARGNAEREKELMAALIDQETGKPKTLEGAMIKDPNALYEKRKCHAWQKIKAEETEDLTVIGAYPGEAHTKYEHCLGGLIVDRRGVEVRVGGGFSDPEREEFWRVWQNDFKRVGSGLFEVREGTKGTVFKNMSQIALTASCGVLGRLLEVKFHEVTPDGSLRHPRFVRFRSDKEGEAAA